MKQDQSNQANESQNSSAQNAALLSVVTAVPNPAEDITTYLPGWSIVWNGIQTIYGNYAFIACDPTGTYYGLAIRGSLPPIPPFSWYIFANWILEDLNIEKQVDWKYVNDGSSGALISLGSSIAFYNLLLMEDALGSGLNIFDYLKNNAITPGKQVIIAGHSLGGNMANVYASYFVTQLTQDGASTDNVSLYTFAAPAAGNKDFAQDLDNKLSNAWHYENTNDIVPKFPVADDVALIAGLYNPAPSAAKINITYKGKTFTLQEVILKAAVDLNKYKYHQQALNYTKFTSELDGSYTTNSLKDFFDQAGAQHSMTNYAAYLGLTLPQPPTQELKLY